MYTFRVQPLTVGHFEQRQQYVAPDLGRSGAAGNPEAISTAGNFDIEAAFDLPQVFIELATQVRQAVVISGLEDNVPKNPDSIQNLYLKPLGRKLPVWPTGRRP
jgi:hypothetical protein